MSANLGLLLRGHTLCNLHCYSYNLPGKLLTNSHLLTTLVCCDNTPYKQCMISQQPTLESILCLRYVHS